MSTYREQQEKEAAEFYAKPRFPDDDPKVHFGRLDVRVGRITRAYRFPPDHKQYTQAIDLGPDDEEGGLASSELVPYYKPEELIGRFVCALTNVIPLDDRGICCRTQVMTATDIKWNQVWADHVELLVPPKGSVPGDQITVVGSPHNPDRPFVNPNNTVFERIAERIKVNHEGQAVYKGVPLEVVGKGFVTAETLRDCSVEFD